jgi:hypothetical protein
MKTLKYEAPRGTRIKYGFLGVTVDDLWYSEELRAWGTSPELIDKGATTSSNFQHNVRTVRAFRRFVRKHPQFRGKMTLCSRWVGHNVYA